MCLRPNPLMTNLICADHYDQKDKRSHRCQLSFQLCPVPMLTSAATATLIAATAPATTYLPPPVCPRLSSLVSTQVAWTMSV